MILSRPLQILVQATRRKCMSDSKGKEILLTLPSLSWMFFFFVFPALLVYSFAFREIDENGTLLSAWNCACLQTIFTWKIGSIALRTVTLSFLTTITCLIIALPVSYHIASCSATWQKLLLLLILIPLWSCFLVRIFAWKVLLHPDGFLKQMLVSFHLISEKTSLLYNDITVYVVMVYSYLPFAIIPLYSAASKFNFSLFEAAMDLGATKTVAFRKIFIPYMKPAILSAALLVLIPAAGAYVIPDVVGGPDSEMLGNTIARKVFVDRNLPQASALAILLSCIIFIPALIITHYKNYLLSRTTQKQELRS